MTIYLYHIEGISETDTLCPLLEGEYDTQGFEEYIQNGLVKEVQSSYYPPYYKNTITLSDDDATFDSTINYVGLYDEDNKKFYYYFVREYHYVSESVISLSIEMDVIMTYMTNIRLSNIVIERKFINRWNGTLINRNYIRENVSNGDFILKDYKEIPFNHDLGWYIVKCSNFIGDTTDGYRTASNLIISTNAGKVNSPYFYYFIPISITDKVTTVSSRSIKVIEGGDSASHYEMQSYSDRTDFTNFKNLNDSAIVSCVYVPYDIFNCSIYQNKATLPISLVYHPKACMYILLSGDVYSTFYGGPRSFAISDFNRSGLITIDDFMPNNAIATIYNKNYCPCLLDENYYRVGFGEAGNECSYPLYYCKHKYITYIFCLDYLSGYKVYTLTSDGYTIPEFTNSSISVINTLEPEILTDAYQTWQAQNRATLLAGVANSTINGAFSFVNQALSNYTRISNIKALREYDYQTDLGNIAYNDASFINHPIYRNDDDLYYAQGRFRTSQAALMYNAQRRKNAPISNVSYDISNPLGFAISYGAQALNNYYANDIPKTIKSIVPDINTYSYIPYRKIYCVSDIDYCAWYYHMNGYLVMERHDNCSLIDLMKYVHNRLYFNVLKLADCDVHLDGCIESTELTSLIKARLIKGMRLWDTGQGQESNGIYLEYLKYDNVELSNLNK